MGSGQSISAVQRKVCSTIRFLAFTVGKFRWLFSLHTHPSLVSLSMEALYRELYSGLQFLLDGWALKRQPYNGLLWI